MKSTHVRLTWIVSAVFTLAVLPTSALAAVIFSSTQTGAQLASNPDITFHETGTVVGDDLNFTSGAAGFEMFLFEWSLVPAGSRGDLTINIGINYTAITLDNDFVFGLHDGTNISAWERSNNDGGSWWFREGPVNGTNNPPVFGQTATGLGAVDPFTLVYTVLDSGPVSAVATELGSSPTMFDYLNNPIDGDAALTFFMARNGVPEAYGVQSVSIEIDDQGVAVPEPTTLTLMGIGLAGIGFARRRKRLLALA